MRLLSTIIFLFFLVNLSSAQEMESFEYKKFKSTEGLSFSSDTQNEKSKIQLTPARGNRRGGLWYGKRKMPVSDSFHINFCFKIYKNGGQGPSGKGGEGIALVIHNNELFSKNGEKGEGLAYTGIPNSFVIEFDTQDQEDMGEQHVSVQTNGPAPNSYKKEHSIASMPLDMDIKDGKEHNASIRLINGELAISIDGRAVLNFPCNISDYINLEGGAAFVGLVASTGKTYSVHEIGCFTMEAKKNRIPFGVEGRAIKNVKKVTVYSPNIRIKVWDINQEDGDIISLNLNGEWIVKDFLLSNAGNVFEINLDGQANYLVMHAHNLGEIPPNTAGVLVMDETGETEVMLRANMLESDALMIEYHKGVKQGDVSRYRD
ncbi:MAG: L-type lectin-domain containing protein [Saprospiraceae bacterium]